MKRKLITRYDSLHTGWFAWYWAGLLDVSQRFDSAGSDFHELPWLYTLLNRKYYIDEIYQVSLLSRFKV